MHRIDGTGATIDNRFTEGSPTSGVPATVVTDDWLNDVQENIMAVLAATGVPATKGRAADLLDSIIALSGHGQCRLSVVSVSTLKLMPYGGSNLVINGVPQQIPSAGVTVSNAGLAASTAYYVYAFMNAGVMTLELSTTGRSTGTNGVEIKSGAPSRTLVGWTNTGGGALFKPDTSSAIETMNWFNRRQRTVVNSSGADIAFTNTSIAELSSLLRAYAPAWAGDSCVSNINGNFLNAVSGAGVNVQLYSDDGAQGTRMSSNLSADIYCPFNTQAALLPVSDGMLNCQLYANVGSGTGKIVVGAQLLITSMV